MKTKKKLFVLVLLLIGFQLNAQFDSSKTAVEDVLLDTPAKMQGDIVDVAASISDFSTLVTAVKAAELVETLKGDGPFTVFAPTNDAFSKLPSGTLESLLKAENKGQLAKILKYHVVVGKVMASDVISAVKNNRGKYTIKTVSGDALVASINNGNVVLTDAAGNTSTISKTDVGASNGVIHVIDTVVLPE